MKKKNRIIATVCLALYAIFNILPFFDKLWQYFYFKLSLDSAIEGIFAYFTWDAYAGSVGIDILVLAFHMILWIFIILCSDKLFGKNEKSTASIIYPIIATVVLLIVTVIELIHEYNEPQIMNNFNYALPYETCSCVIYIILIFGIFKGNRLLNKK